MTPDGALGQGAGGEGARAHYAPNAAGRTRAFQSAARHSLRVKRLRKFIIGGAAALSLGVVGYSWFGKSREGDSHFSLESIGVSGSKVTMRHPHLTGVRRDGTPFEVIAESGVQDPRDPTKTTLTQLDAHLRVGDGGPTRVTGDQGLYDSTAQTLALSGNVHIKNASFDLLMQSADMNFKTNAMRSDRPVRVDFNGGWVLSDAMTMSDNSERITFTGNVHSEFAQASPDDGAQAPRKDN